MRDNWETINWTSSIDPISYSRSKVYKFVGVRAARLRLGSCTCLATKWRKTNLQARKLLLTIGNKSHPQTCLPRCSCYQNICPFPGVQWNFWRFLLCYSPLLYYQYRSATASLFLWIWLTSVVLIWTNIFQISHASRTWKISGGWGAQLTRNEEISRINSNVSY